MSDTLTREWRAEEDGVWEYRTRVEAVATCPKCGKDVDLIAETDTWMDSRKRPQVKKHGGYGPATGECCGLLIADWWEGTFCYEFPVDGAA